MKIFPGIFLKSSPSPGDPHFDDTVIFIAEYNDQGAIGFVADNLFPRTLNELEEFKHSRPVKIYAGGPMENDKLYFIHQRPDIITGGEAVANGIYYGGNFDEAIAAVNSDIISQHDIRVFIGYCGWDPQQLEQELNEGGWGIAAFSKADFFHQ